MLALLFAWSNEAYACAHGGLGTDADADGWCTNDIPADCNDSIFGGGGASTRPRLRTG